MNHVYRIYWSAAANTFVAMAVTAGLLAGAQAIAAPTGGEVSAGQATIAQSGATTTINQGTPRVAINWQGFNVGASEIVNFVQPSSSAVALNRISGNDGSRILGQLNANGQVFLQNSNGVLFGANAQVNVGGLLATTLNISDADFMGGNYAFTGTPGSRGSVVNQGRLKAADGGYIALIGPQVRNEGVISATLGTVLLAAGDKVSVTLNNGILWSYSIDQGALDALAENKQLIHAGGGQVLMSAKAADALATAVVNNTGVIQARTLESKAGLIMLMGEMESGRVNVAGTLDASAPDGGNGGFIETSAAHVNVANDAKVSTAAPAGLAGAWLIDPVDFTIAATGGNISGATLSTSLGAGSVLIQSSNGTAGTAGDVNVNDVVSWSANKLTLNALNNININANLNASGTASLALEFGQGTVASGNASNVITTGAKVNLPAGTTNFTTRQGSNGVTKAYTVITALGAQGSTTATDLQGVSGALTASYALGADIDAAGTSTWDSGAGFAPIGTFSGTFEGLGHAISNLSIHRPATDNVGLFGSTSGARVQNLSLVNANVTGRDNVGALFGSTVVGTAIRSHASGQVSGRNRVGGLVGYNNTTAFSYSHAASDVAGSSSVGGLMGETNGGITSVFNAASGEVVGSGTYVGGLVGYNGFAFHIASSYATGSVSGPTDVGGLVGFHLNGAITNSYSTGNVSGGAGTGGLVGNNSAGSVGNSYATGSVSSASVSAGGLIGIGTPAAVSNSYWDTVTSGQATSPGGGAGRNSAQMRQQGNFASWDFASTWRIYEGITSPLLLGLMTPLTVTANSGARTYDGLSHSGGFGVAYSTPVDVIAPSGTLTYGGTAQGKANAGTYSIAPAGLQSNQQYLITFVDGALTIGKAPLTVTATAASKTYDANTSASVTMGALTGLVGSETLNVTATGTFDDKNVASGKTVSVVYLLADGGAGGLAGNYSLADASLAADISAASLFITGVTAGDKVFDGTTAAILGGAAAVSVLGTDAVTVNNSGSGAFADAAIGTGKAVSVAGFTLSGADAGNYLVVQPAGLTADITATLPPPPAEGDAVSHLESYLLPPVFPGQCGSARTDPQVCSRIETGALWQIVDGGVRLPEGKVNLETPHLTSKASTRRRQ